ncbi:MAG: acyl-CoA dehydrogenase family protein [Sphingomonadales bacterium]
MDFQQSARSKEVCARLQAFMDEHIYPNEETWESQMHAFGENRWQVPRILEDLKKVAKAEGLWNMFLPDSPLGAGLTNLDFAPMHEIMGKVGWAGEVFNCSAPDTGNMEVLERYGTAEHKERWLKPLLDGEIRSAFLMTEPAVASSDATNISTSIVRDGNEYVINGRKWWSSGVPDPRCKVYILMGKTDPNAPTHLQQSMIVVPASTPGITVVRTLPVFGFDHAPHGHAEVLLENVRVPASNLLLGEGRGFEIAQGRLGPGRIHHCMRAIGVAERALEKTCKRLVSRTAFGKKLSEQSLWVDRVADARTEINSCRLLVYHAAWMMDTVGNKVARSEIAQIKVACARMTQRVVDMAIQAHGGGGVTTDFGLAEAYAYARILRIVDGPDEVHNRSIGTMELRKYTNR